MPNVLYEFPTQAMVVMVIGFLLVLTWAGALFVRPLARTLIRHQPGVNDIVAYLLGAHGVYFGILLGLLSVAAYGNYSATEALVTEESAKLAAVYRDSASYPEPFRTQLTDILREYTEYTINEAWPLQREGKVPAKGQTILDRFQGAMIKYEPKSRAQEILHAELFSHFNLLLEAQRKRVLAVTSAIPDILWFVVYIGAIVNILWVWLLDMKLVPQLFLGGITSFYLATLIALLGAMDKPFRGKVSVSSDPYRFLYESVMTKQLGGAVVPTGAASKTEEKKPGDASSSAGGKASATSTEAELKKLGEELKKADAAAKKSVEIANPDAALKKVEEMPEKETVVPVKPPPAKPEPKAPAPTGDTRSEPKKTAAELDKADAAAKEAAEVVNPDAAPKKP